ncbi:pilus assembly protein [Oerskovia sp. Sa2CUA9]|uniref:Pilus assembly protein n=1 Tax=Oerskovia merdavium TaxID=2762227 RepID=A0ABR8TZJ1_9CELL|nr:pilus assembly protein [Oerskovia merdavium]
MNFRHRSHVRARDDAGNAQVEFLGVALVLILPVLYLALTLGRIQAATFAVEGAAKESARAFVTADSVAEGQVRAGVATSLALSDQGFEDVQPSDVLELTCSADPCLAPGSEVVAVVRYDVALPFVPSGIRSWVPLSIPVQAVHTSTVDRYAGARP